MDIFKLLNGGTSFIDHNPDSDTDNNTSRIVHISGGGGMDSKEKPKKMKSRKVETSPESLTYKEIIEEKPNKAKMIKYLKARIEALVDEDSD